MSTFIKRDLIWNLTRDINWLDLYLYDEIPGLESSYIRGSPRFHAAHILQSWHLGSGVELHCLSGCMDKEVFYEVYLGG